MENLQRFVSQPSYEKNGWEVARFYEKQQNYIPLKGEIYPTKKQAQERAAELNKEYEEENN